MIRSSEANNRIVEVLLPSQHNLKTFTYKFLEKWWTVTCSMYLSFQKEQNKLLFACGVQTFGSRRVTKPWKPYTACRGSGRSWNYNIYCIWAVADRGHTAFVRMFTVPYADKWAEGYRVSMTMVKASFAFKKSMEWTKAVESCLILQRMK